MQTFTRQFYVNEKTFALGSVKLFSVLLITKLAHDKIIAF